MASKRGEEVKRKMILAALDLFHEKGVRATSPQDVLDRTGTGKSQFYHYFESKEGLVQATLAYFHQEQQAGNFNNKPLETWQDLEDWFQFFLNAQQYFKCERSCPIGTIANELDISQDQIRDHVNIIFNEAIENLTHFFQQQKQQKKLNADVVPEEIARFCFLTIQGGLLLSKVQRDIKPLEDAVNHAKRYVISLKR